MTYAICIRCGKGKVGAFVPCLRCGFEPASSTDKARSLVLSDHNADEAMLDEAAEKLAAGEPLEFDEEGIDEMAAEIDEIAKHPLEGLGGRAVFVWVLIGVAVTLFVLVVALVWYARAG